MIAGTFRTVSNLNRDLRTLFLTTLLFRAGTMAFPFLAAYLLVQGGYDAVGVALIVGLFGVGALLADVSSSVFLGRVPARSVIVGGAVTYAATLLAVPLLPVGVPLAVTTLIWGFAFEIVTPAVYSQIIECSSPEERKVAFACNRLAINVGMGIGPALGGVLFAVLPVALFGVNAVCALGAIAVLLARSPARRAHRRDPAPQVRLLSPTRRAETRFWTVFGLALPVHVAFALPPVLMSVHLIGGLGLPSYWVSLLFAVNAVVIVLFEVPVNTAMAGMSYARSLWIGYALTAAGFVLMAVADTGIVLLLVTLVWTAGEMIVFPGLLGYVSHLSDRSIANRNVSLYSGGANIGFAVAPPIAALLTAAGGPGTPWLAAGLAVATALVLLRAARLSSWTWQGEGPEPGRGAPAPSS